MSHLPGDISTKVNEISSGLIHNTLRKSETLRKLLRQYIRKVECGRLRIHDREEFI
jgi:hypothetical protein